MFRSVTLTDYQSHQSTHLELGPFTVIVGSSSSGKSAIVRALRLVAENARGTSYVRQGAKSARVALELSGNEPVLESSTVVTIERGKGISTYTLRLPGMHHEPVEFTKCAGNVPDAVDAALELGESKLWIAGQFDRPYLLDETGAEVARVLGKLTNVNMIYAAVREANRRASEARRLHTARSGELEAARSDIKKYVSLPGRLAAGRAAEESLNKSEALADRAERLSERIMEVTGARTRAANARGAVREVPDVARLLKLSEARTVLTERLVELRSVADRRSSVTTVSGPVPDVATFGPLLTRRASLREALQTLASTTKSRERFATQVQDASIAAESARTKFSEALSSAGSCPLCGASAAHAQVDHVV